jgi:hypothetical protein
MAHATSAPSGSPHRGSTKFTATALCWLLASRERQGPAVLTGQKADSKRGCAYRHRDPATHRFEEVHILPLISGQSLFLFWPRCIPFRAWSDDPAPLNDALPDSPTRMLSDH